MISELSGPELKIMNEPHPIPSLLLMHELSKYEFDGINSSVIVISTVGAVVASIVSTLHSNPET